MAASKIKPCPTCGGITSRNDKYDAYFCPTCDAWTEKVCGDPSCHFCVNRPAKPSMVSG